MADECEPFLDMLQNVIFYLDISNINELELIFIRKGLRDYLTD